MTTNPDLQQFIDKTGELAKAEMKRRGDTLDARIFLFFQSEGFSEGMLIPNSPALFADITTMRSIPRVINTAYVNMINIYSEMQRTIELKAVVMVTDAYVENIDKMPEPGARRTTAFTPQPGQQEAISIAVYEKEKTYNINWLYKRRPEGIVFSSDPDIAETKHLPGSTRLGDLWPADAR